SSSLTARTNKAITLFRIHVASPFGSPGRDAREPTHRDAHTNPSTSLIPLNPVCQFPYPEAEPHLAQAPWTRSGSTPVHDNQPTPPGWPSHPCPTPSGTAL